MSLARQHRERVLAAQTVVAVDPTAAGAASPAADRAAAGAAAQIALRLTHDLRRLKEIKSVERKVEAKREMLPEYSAWIAGVLQADAGVGEGVAAEVLPTMMVWAIDTGNYRHALAWGAFVLRHNVAMPARYNRDAATVLLEEIAAAALRAQTSGARFPLDVLEEVEALTAGVDMHDEPRAKLAKAIGFELMKVAADATGEEAVATHNARALDQLRRAQALDERIGVKGRIGQLEKLLKEPAAPAA